MLTYENVPKNNETTALSKGAFTVKSHKFQDLLQLRGGLFGIGRRH